MKGKTNTTQFFVTEEQKEVIAKHFGKKAEDMEFWQICELLDQVIDRLEEKE